MPEESDLLRVRLVTPDEVLADETAEAVEICAASGYMEVLYGHAPLLAELGVGHVCLRGGSSGDRCFFVVAWGFCEVLPDRVTILAASSERLEGLDIAAAERELERGRRMWSEAGDDTEKYERANAVIHEAEAKLAAIKEGIPRG